MKQFKKGDAVKWKWGNGWGHGKVQSSYTRKVTRKIAGEEITRNGDEKNSAYYVAVSEGNNVLKLQSELSKDN